ncbi:serine hydrolase [Viridibacillus sp. YIM B01967]|uniref:Serine hydrolase n=1 Tax=Viridibacillus soli TaxID=2798301 RepID=A0ABS1HCH2_9BACL|nr:serine hydrolase [Viridibacillus soli]MBK3497135.1 serine hydrolase [Viridibacillus soli]
MKIALWIIVGVVISLVLIRGIVTLISRREKKKLDPKYITRFIKEKLESGNVSLSIRYNDQNWIDINRNQLLPLASTVKIIIAIEYAQQAAEAKIDPNKKVRLKEIDKFYIPKTDGGSHEEWIKQWKRDDIDSVPLYEVANGMIAYSSNANTEYLIEVLGLKNINHVPKSLGILNHDPMYPTTSALYIPTQLMNEKNLSKQEILELMKDMDMSEYRRRAIDIHNRWINQPLSDQEKKQLIKNLDMDFQKNWSNRLPRSTTRDYVSMMNKLNRKTYFKENVYKYLDPVMEQIMKNQKNREWLVHAGQKGGSTAFVLTIAMYATDKEQNKTEIVFFANNLTTQEQKKLLRNLNEFQLKFLKDEKFRTQVRESI